MMAILTNTKAKATVLLYYIKIELFLDKILLWSFFGQLPRVFMSERSICQKDTVILHARPARF